VKRLKHKADGALRSLEVLVPLIKQAVSSGDEATQRGMEFYREAGEMLLEAKEQVGRGQWLHWLSENFHLSSATAHRWMLVASTEGDFDSQREVERHTRARTRIPSGLPENIRRILRGLTPDVEALGDSEISESRESKLMRKLAAQVVDAGFRVMSMKLHPDHGGSNEAMRRLNQVRAALKNAVEARLLLS